MTIRILFAEDNAADAELVERELRGTTLDYTIQHVATREDFAAAVREHPPQLIISDHNLGGFTGREALEMARATLPEVPFILVTGSLDEETAVGYIQTGAADYILKDRLARLGPAVLGALSDAHGKAALRREQALLRHVLDASPSMIFVKDWHGAFQLANRAVAEMYGTTPDAVIGRRDADFNPDPEEEARFVADDRAVMRDAEMKVIPEEPVTNPATGETRWFQTIKVPLRLPGEDTLMVLGIATDITERRRVEEQFRQAQKMEAVGRLAGGIAHDFNNVLTAVLGYAELLLPSFDEDDGRRQDVTEIRNAANRAAALTRQLLAFSRKQVLEPRVIDLNAVVGAVGNMLQRLIGEDIALRTLLAPDLGATLADPGQMEQVIMNLAVNARDAMPQGGKLTIETTNVELDDTYALGHIAVEPGPYVMMSVSDIGVGMDKETRARLFEPFFTTKGAGRGTGLGLATVYGIVKQSGGSIWVYSEPGKGTTFKLYLPRVAERPTEAAEIAEPRLLRGSEIILLVEDEQSVRALASRVLTASGYTVLDAERGEQALELAAAHDGDLHLLLTDVVMPDISGHDVATRLAATRPGLRVLYMSGYTDNAIVHHGILDTGVAFLEKPFTPDALLRKVRVVLETP